VLGAAVVMSRFGSTATSSTVIVTQPGRRMLPQIDQIVTSQRVGALGATVSVTTRVRASIGFGFAPSAARS